LTTLSVIVMKPNVIANRSMYSAPLQAVEKLIGREILFSSNVTEEVL